MDLTGLVGQMIGVINTTIPVLASLALVFFLWGIVRYIHKAGDAGSKEGDRQIFIWGLVALFVMVSVWGIIATMCLNLFGDRNCQNVQNVQCTGTECVGPY
jgi:hypothetical protein